MHPMGRREFADLDLESRLQRPEADFPNASAVASAARSQKRFKS